MYILWSNVIFINATWEQYIYAVWIWWCSLSNKALFKCFHNFWPQFQFSFCKRFLAWNSNFFNTTPRSKADRIKRCSVQLAATASKVLQPLPKEYTTVHFFVLNQQTFMFHVFLREKLFRNTFSYYKFTNQKIVQPEDHLPTPKKRLCVTNVDRC